MKAMLEGKEQKVREPTLGGLADAVTSEIIRPIITMWD